MREALLATISSAIEASGTMLLRKIVFALLVLLHVTVPLEAVGIIGEVGSITRLIGLLVFGLGFPIIVARSYPRPLAMFLMAVSLYFLWGALSIFWTVNEQMTSERIVTGLQLLGLVWLICATVRSVSQAWVLMNAYAVGSLLAAGITIFSYISGRAYTVSDDYDRYTAFEKFDPNYACVMMAIAVPVIWRWGFLGKRVRVGMVAAVAALLVLLIASFLTGSRGGFLALLTALLVVPVSMRFMPLGQLLFLAACVAVVAVAVSSVAIPSAAKRLTTIPEEIAHGTGAHRTTIWRKSLRVFLNNPFVGVGYGTHRAVVAGPRGGAVAHNAFIEVLTEQGVIGLALFGWIILASMRSAGRLAPAERHVLVFTCLALVVGSMSISTGSWKFTWLVMAWPVVASALTAYSPPEQPSVISNPRQEAFA